MILTYKFAENLMKIFFSIIILQLLAISVKAGMDEYSPMHLIKILEYPAASCMCTVGGRILMEYVLDKEQN